LIVVALETCCRRGELLALTWADVDLTRRELRVRAARSKSRRLRILPISAGSPGIDLHFHDLRHETGSRLLESGWLAHHVQTMLGQAISPSPLIVRERLSSDVVKSTDSGEC
jgi:integrase